MRAVSVAFSLDLPSRRKNEPGILPAAYIRSSTSTVSGRKSTSRRPPMVAVLRTIVSPLRTTTAPLACFASLPVSKEIVLSPTSAVTRVTLNLLIRIFTSGRPDGGHSFLYRTLVPIRLKEYNPSHMGRIQADRDGRLLQAVSENHRRWFRERGEPWWFAEEGSATPAGAT